MASPYSEQHPSIVLALRVLGYSHMSAQVLADNLNVTGETGRRIMLWLRSRNLVRVSYWVRQHGGWERVYKIADGKPDAFRPAAFTSAQNSKRFRNGKQTRIMKG